MLAQQITSRCKEDFIKSKVDWQKSINPKMTMLARIKVIRNVSVASKCQGAKDAMMFARKRTEKPGEMATEYISLKKDDK